MPSISEFYGIKIYIYYAHGKHKASYFHARYQGFDASFSIETQQVFAGQLPPRMVKIIQIWAKTHQKELKENWELVQKRETPKLIQGADND